MSQVVQSSLFGSSSPLPTEGNGDLQSLTQVRELIRRSRSKTLVPSPNAHDALVSVVVLNLNGEAVLPDCLSALAAQTHSKFEILVVDNGSTDQSFEIFKKFSADTRFRWIQSSENLGVGGGRNLGWLQARGEVVAFIDNDGYAEPNWLSQSLAVLSADKNIGAVAPLVFFNSDKLKLNGAGGTINLQGYACDICFGESYSADLPLPHEVCYPMGCGMVLSRKAADSVFPLDAILPKWFDDVEVGLRLWRLGYKVVLAPDAIVDHGFHGSDKQLSSSAAHRAWLFESARIRTKLKYTPLALLPSWLAAELKLNLQPLRPRHLILGALVWAWNLFHLPSVIKIRSKYSAGETSLPPPVKSSWGRLHD